MKPTAIPYVFNPKRHRNYLRLVRFKRVATILFTISCGFLLTTALFGRAAMGGLCFLLIAIITTVVTGLLFLIVHRMLKERKH